MPSSKDSVSIKAKKSSRRVKGGKIGGQKDHDGHTLMQFDLVDDSKECVENKCSCGCSLNKVQGVIRETRQVVDIPMLHISITEFIRIDKHCPRCQNVVKGKFPQNVISSVQYGPNLQALVVGLNTEYKIPFAKISELIQQQYGITINISTLCNMNKKCFMLLEEPEKLIKEYLFSQDLIHADETSLVMNTTNYWMHVLSNKRATFLKVHKNRGSESFESGLQEYTGRIVHDFYSSYFKLKKAQHNTCGSHIERECEALIEDESNWAQKMKALLLELFSNEYEYNISKRTAIYSRFTKIINAGIREEPAPIRTGTRGREKKSKGLNLLLRLKEHRDEIIEYAFNPNVPFTNNQAERDLRHCKVKLKVSGCFRSIGGANAYARIISFISTLRKNGINLFDELTRLFNLQPLVLNLT